ncbi:hypothetical protein [Sphingosinithalassobacter sp. LHW66-3]|uniref:hypothetical protein n=1 Tax=Sphingosinithalassobacter sp. LHW66-3 TaxID=3424718 RepID=UPI003D6AAF7C
MSGPIHTLATWLLLLTPPSAWFAHFLFVYGAASVGIVLNGEAGASSRVAIGVATLVVLILLLLCWFLVGRITPNDADSRKLWIVSVRLLVIVSVAGVLYQTVPALLVP